MIERYFFDTSAILAVLKREPQGAAIKAMMDSLSRMQRVSSVLVAYELYRGVPLSSTKRRSQLKAISIVLDGFALKPVHEAHAMAAAKLYQHSKGKLDPLLAAQCVDGGFIMVTTNRRDFERVPGLRLATLSV